MAINHGSVQYNNDGFLPDILLLTQAPIFVWFEMAILYILLTMYYSVFCFVMLGGSAWRLFYKCTV